MVDFVLVQILYDYHSVVQHYQLILLDEMAHYLLMIDVEMMLHHRLMLFVIA